MNNEIIVNLVQGAERLRELYRVSYGALSRMLQLCRSTYRRWRMRIRCNQDPLQKPGPKPLKPLDYSILSEGLHGLRHSKKRSLGVGKLQAATKGFISRRELSEMVAHTRNDSLREYRGSQSILHWQVPGAVWSMDIFETAAPVSPGNCFVLNTQDLASGYKLPPYTDAEELKGVDVASHLEQLFERFGPPLFLKRDNGGNLNHSSITEALSRWYVLPLNSPAYYAPYNGAIEHGQGEVKNKLRQDHNNPATFGELTQDVALAVHDLNHQPRRKLSGDTSCLRFFSNPRFKYIKRKRKEVFLWINERALGIVKKAADKITPAAAWRIACRIWLVENGLLSISKSGNVLPHLSEKSAHS